MHDVHVNRKEKTMNRYIMEEFHNNPALLRRRLMTAAHRERARAIGEGFAWLFGSLARLPGYLKARLTPGNRSWIARLG